MANRFSQRSHALELMGFPIKDKNALFHGLLKDIKETLFIFDLFCHHLTNSDLLSFLSDIKERSPLAYYGIKLLTPIFSKLP
jgi:hypothetical protein